MMAQELQLLLGFDAFGNDVQAELLRHCEDSGADGRVILVGMQVFDE
jgi:hypothetical protein